MSEHKKIHNSPIEINDLIDDAVKNAMVRRHAGLDATEGLLSVSEEEAEGVTGGLSLPGGSPIINGIVLQRPFIYGIIINPTNIPTTTYS